MSSSIRFRINLFLLGVAILWPMFQVFFFNSIDGLGRVKIIITILAIVANGNHLFNVPKVMLVWLLWIVFCVINAQFKGFYFESITFPYWVHHRLLFPYIITLVGYQAVTYDWRRTICVLFGIYLVYVIVGMFKIDNVESYDVEKRMTNELGNAYLNTSVLLMSYTSLMFVFKKIKLLPFLLIILILIYIILLSGERKGFIGLFIIIIGSFIGIKGGKGWRSIIGYIFIGIVASVSIYLVMKYTVFGVRMEEGLENTNFQDHWFLTLMGDRGIQYYEGWQFFLSNPWTGIGIRNFAVLNSFWTDGNGVLHSEYMVQLAECGIIGTTMFIIFNYGMLRRLFAKVSNIRDYSIITILRATLLAIMTINLVTWSYDNENVFLMYGIIYAMCEKLKNEHALKTPYAIETYKN